MINGPAPEPLKLTFDASQDLRIDEQLVVQEPTDTFSNSLQQSHAIINASEEFTKGSFMHKSRHDKRKSVFSKHLSNQNADIDDVIADQKSLELVSSARMSKPRPQTVPSKVFRRRKSTSKRLDSTKNLSSIKHGPQESIATVATKVTNSSKPKGYQKTFGQRLEELVRNFDS